MIRAKNLVRLFSTKYSSTITQNPQNGAAQAMLYATGMKKKDMDKNQIGIATMWYEGNPCNMHLSTLANYVKTGVIQNNMIGRIFNTMGVSDGISMGTEGMRYSLLSREIIVDSIEAVMYNLWYDANILIPGCDKNIPGCMMAMARHNRPSIMVYGGSIASGCHNNQKTDIVSAFQSYGQYLSGEISNEERENIIQTACPGAGSCGGMYTANTMACVAEVMGLTLPNSSSNPANSFDKSSECYSVSEFIKILIHKDIKPLDIMTKESFLNAIKIIMVLGGSTNAVLHLLALAKTANVDINLDTFQQISDTTPYLADLKPSGKYLMEDVHLAGGTTGIINYLIKEGIINGDCLTVTGKTLKDNYLDFNLPQYSANMKLRNIIKSVDNPIKSTGHINILYGNIAPEGCVAKITNTSTIFEGIANVFDGEKDMLTALKDNQIRKGDVIIIRYEGPTVGMPEMLTPTSALVGAGFKDDVALITDGRFSGGSHGYIIGHVSPEAYKGGPIALINNGDKISINFETKTINVNITDDEMEYRKNNYIYKKTNTTGVLRKYGKLFESASLGCVTVD